jgi:dephospho-CoA kinase
MKKRIIGLTGGIACGKSTVSAYLSLTYSIPVLDADVYAREAVALGSPILAQIFDRYGEKVQQSDRSLNRQKLGEIIFGDPQEKQWLEIRFIPMFGNVSPGIQPRSPQKLSSSQSRCCLKRA